jgi:hypothetical protein
MLHRVALVTTNILEELRTFIIRVTRIVGLGTTSAVTSIQHMFHRLPVTTEIPSSPILVTLMKEAVRSSETSVLRRATQRNIPEDAILHSHHRENPKTYTLLNLHVAYSSCNLLTSPATIHL